MKLLYALALIASPALAEDHAILAPYDGSFDDALFSVENAIVNQGLVIDYRSRIGEMLDRTREDFDGKALFDNAEAFIFCSARVSREVMEADPTLIAFCPYSVFVTDTDGTVEIGYRTYPDGPMDAVEDLLESIVAEAVAF